MFFSVSTRKDIHRKIHFADGSIVVSGSFDRKVQLRNVNTGKICKVIKGHSGSVKCVFVLEKRGLVISGSYDTSVRYVPFIHYSLYSIRVLFHSFIFLNS